MPKDPFKELTDSLIKASPVKLIESVAESIDNFAKALDSLDKGVPVRTETRERLSDYLEAARDGLRKYKESVECGICRDKAEKLQEGIKGLTIIENVVEKALEEGGDVDKRIKEEIKRHKKELEIFERI